MEPKKVKKAAKIVSRTKVPAATVVPEPVIDLAASMVIVLEALQNGKSKEKGEVANVLTGHRF